MTRQLVLAALAALMLTMIGGCLLDDTTNYRVGGYLHHSDGGFVSDARVFIVNNDDEEIVALDEDISDRDGEFLLEVEQTGSYTILASHEGAYGDLLAVEQITVSLEDGDTLNLYMEDLRRDVVVSEDGTYETARQPLADWGCVYDLFWEILRSPGRYPDPLNHCYGACMARRSCGVSIRGTLFLSVAKEVCDMFNIGICNDAELLDLWADLKGITCSYTGRTCYGCCS